MMANNFKNYFSNFFQPMDMNVVKGMVSKNVEAITAANQVWMEGMQVASKRNVEVMQNSAQKGFDCFKDCCANQNMQEMQKCQSNFFQDVINNLSSNAREIMEMSSKASLEVFDILNKRTSEVVNEVYCASQAQKACK